MGQKEEDKPIIPKTLYRVEKYEIPKEDIYIYILRTYLLIISFVELVGL